MSGNIRVVCRFRPQNSKEVTAKGKVVVDFLDEQTVHLNGKETDHKFTFDRIFIPTNSQQEVYETTALVVVQDIFNGYNGTIFVYGQTSSGKTHTMMGPDGGKGMEDPAMKGIIPRMVSTIFDQVANADENFEFTVCVSYIEIYMEKIRDLLNPANDNLPVRENKERGIYVEGTTDVSVACEEDVMRVMRTGQSNRSVGFTKMNAESSRSHSLFIVNVMQKDITTGSKKNGKLYLVDLAGSEKVGKTGAKGTTLEEAKMINKSLSALGNVINALTDGKSKHIPYRDSKLTRVLQESIGGNSRTTLIVNCSPDSSNEMETLSTLRFGTRAKSIKNKAKVNEERSVAEMKVICTKLQKEIVRLRKYVSTLEGELGIVKNGGKSTLAADSASLALSTTNSAPSVVQGSPGIALKELYGQIQSLEEKIATKEELLNAGEEAKTILKDQLAEKGGDFEELELQMEKIQIQVNVQQDTIQALQQEHTSFIKQLSSKDMEMEVMRGVVGKKSKEAAALEQMNAKLAEEKEQLCGKLHMNSKRKRSTSVQKIQRNKTNWLQKEEEIENNLSRSFDKIITPELQLSEEESSNLTRAIAETKNHLADFKDFQIALLADWKSRSKKLVQLQEYLAEASSEFEVLQQCNLYSLREENLIMAAQLEKIQATQISSAYDNEMKGIELTIAEEKLLHKDKRIQELENQLKLEREQRIASDHQYTKQFEEFAKQIESQRKTFVSSPAVKTLRGGGGHRRPTVSQPGPKTTGWDQFVSFFKPTAPSPKRPLEKRPTLEMKSTNVFDE